MEKLGKNSVLCVASSSKLSNKVSRLNSKVEAGVKYDPQLASSMQWTMKYAPQCAEDIIGNSGIVRDLASWLGQWEGRNLSSRRKQAKVRNALRWVSMKRVVEFHSGSGEIQ